ncbi:heavy metal translocatin [Aureobasidium pullulans]|nr:heavy metal translocatin [Aureobasidium pullulans]
MHAVVLHAANLHCPSCVAHVQDVLAPLPGILCAEEISLINQTIRVEFDSTIANHQSIIKTLVGAAFEIEHVALYDQLGRRIRDYDYDENHHYANSSGRPLQEHIDNCDACRDGSSGQHDLKVQPTDSTSSKTPSDQNPAVIDIEDSSPYTALLSIEGMSCGSCSGKITSGLQELPFVSEATIDLLTNSGSVNFQGKSNVDFLLGKVKDLGYDATLVELVEPKSEPHGVYTASLSIEGMSCGSCSGKITAGLERLPFVTNVNIDLLSNSGTIAFSGEKTNLNSIIQNISDAGYRATVVNVKDPVLQRVPEERVVEIQVTGLHCIRCPERIVGALESLRSKAESGFHITKQPTLREPRVQIKYKPSPTTGLTTRAFIATLQAVDPAFSVSVYHPPTIEERSRLIQHQERKSILWRMIFAGIVAIPSLIIGVIYMSLVPSDNPTRIWWEEPIWAGNAMRLEWALLIMTTPVMIFGTDIFHRRAYKEIWAMWKPGSRVPMLRRFYRFGSMNMLISVGTTVAYFSSLAVLIMNATQKEMHHGMRMSASYFDVITFLTFFILIGRYLEAYSKAKTGDAVTMLGRLRPSEALLFGDDGDTQKVPVDQLEVGDVVKIPQGHSPPADGIVEQSGSFSFDESSLTGESKPVRKSQGDTVFTGTVNVADPVAIRVTEIGGTSMLDQIIEVVRGGQSKRAPIERFADVLTGYFVPVVTILAIVTWITWLSLGLSGRLPVAWLDAAQGGWPFWSLEFAIAVFVVACPCGIGLAAPTALFVGGGLAAKQGILVQGGGQAFQEASNLNTIVFDKTGTLTQGQMKVTDFEQLLPDLSKDSIFAMARFMENMSSHPIAQAITAFCGSSTGDSVVSDLREIPGHGMSAKFTLKSNSGKQQTVAAAIGNSRLLDLLNSDDEDKGTTTSSSSIDKTDTTTSGSTLQQALHRHQVQGHSVAVFAIRQSDRYEAAGIFALSDPLRPEAAEVVTSLRELGLSVHLCTGDNATTAHAIAKQLDIPVENVRAGVLPQGKAEYIHELQHPPGDGRRLVAFTGDGLNDTPALTAADVSISLSSGSDIAINASSFILLNSHLGAIYTLFTLSKRVFLRVKINFFWAGIYNITLIPIAAGILYTIGASDTEPGWRMSPVWAAVAMAGSSVSVVLSSLALKLPEIRLRVGSYGHQKSSMVRPQDSQGDLRTSDYELLIGDVELKKFRGGRVLDLARHSAPASMCALATRRRTVDIAGNELPDRCEIFTQVGHFDSFRPTFGVDSVQVSCSCDEMRLLVSGLLLDVS